jgi:hypothetical protein
MASDNRGIASVIAESFIGFIIGLIWLSIAATGVWFAWPYLKAEYVKRYPERSVEMAVDSGAAAIGALSERVANLKELAQAQAERIRVLEDKERARSGEEFAHITSLLMLERRVASGAPFETELLAAMKTAPVEIRARLAELESLAKTGTTSTRALYKKLDKLAPDIIFKAETGQTSDNILDKMWISIKSLVRVRNVGDAPSGTTEAAVNNTLLALDRGDVVAAAAAFEPISAYSSELRNKLSEAAKVRLAIEGAIARSVK